MIDEKNLQEGLQDIFQAMDGFADADVVINDMSILDRLTTAEAPFLVIRNADTSSVVYDVAAGRYERISIPTVLIVATDARSGKDYEDEFRDARQACFEQIALSTYVTVGAQSCQIMSYSANDEPVAFYESEDSRIPTFIMQDLVLEIEEI